MTRTRTLITALAAGVLAATAAIWMAPAASAATPTAVFTKTSDWGSGWEGKYTITNGGTSTITSWAVVFDLPAG